MPSALTDRGILDGDCPRIEVEPAQAEIEKARELARCWSKHFDLSPDCAALPLCGQPSVHAAGDPADVRRRDDGQLRRLRDVRRDPACLIFAEQLRRRAPPRLVLEIGYRQPI